MSTRRVLLHIGAPKSGTTYVQARLHRNADALAAVGVLVPRAPEADGAGSIAFRAAGDLTGVRLGRGRAYTDGWWERLVSLVRPHRGTVVVSHESFVRCDDAQAARAVAELGPGVEIVYTARDLGRSIVSSWLEGLKHGTRLTFAEHLDAVRTGEAGSMRAFDLPGVLGRWAALAPVHLVTVPPPGGDRSLLWQRFLAACGVDSAAAPDDAERANEAVGLPEAQVLRMLNSRLGQGAHRGRGLHAVVNDVVVRRLAGRPSPRVELDPRHLDWVVDRAREQRAWVEGSRVQVWGDLDDLTPLGPQGAWTDPDVVTPEAAEAAVAAMAALVREVRRLRRSP